MNPYEVLGIGHNASRAEIDAAYRTLCRRYHPDKHENNPLQDLAREKLAEVNAAYELLRDGNQNAHGSRDSGAESRSRQAADPSRASALAADLAHAERLFVEDRHQALLDLCDGAIARHGHLPALAMFRGMALVGLGRAVEAQWVLKQTAQTTEIDVKVLAGCAFGLCMIGNWDDALAVIDRIRRRGEMDADTLGCEGVCHAYLGNEAKARAIAAQIRQVDPGHRGISNIEQALAAQTRAAAPSAVVVNRTSESENSGCFYLVVIGLVIWGLSKC